MNNYLNGNLAQIPVIHIDVLLTPKIKATLVLASTLFCFESNILARIFVYKVINNQTPSLLQCVSLLRENINIFINVAYLYMLHICTYKLKNMISLYNMIPLLCTKVKFHIKYLCGTRLHYP